MESPTDKLDDIFERQLMFMEELRAADVLPEWPVDLTTKPGQRLIKEFIFNAIEELAEASFTLKNKAHRLTDDRRVDIDHFKEELGDALAYLVEICILSGFTAEEMFRQFEKKNREVSERRKRGY